MSSEGQPLQETRLWEELTQLRKRVHKVVGELNGVRLLLEENTQQIKNTAEWVKKTERIIQHLENSVEEMQRADAIAEGIAQRLSERRESKWRTIGVKTAVISAIIAALGTVTDLTLKVVH